MDKPVTVANISSAISNDPSRKQQSAARTEQAWHNTEKSSFESALNRIRDRSADVKAGVEREAQNASTDGASQNLANYHNCEHDQVTSLTNMYEQSSGDELASLIDTKPSESSDSLSTESDGKNTQSSDPMSPQGFNQSQTSDRAISDTAPASAAGAESVSMDVAGSVGAPSAPSAASSNSSSLGSDTLNQMLQHMQQPIDPEATAGQWQFAVLDDPAGVSAVQLVRSDAGQWLIKLSLDESARADRQQLAGELKAVLRDQGHAVQSIVITPVAGDTAGDDG